MRKKLVVLSVLVVCACVAFAEQDPWKQRITDWDPNAPILPTYDPGEWHGGHDLSMLPVADSWSEDGGSFRLWYRDTLGLATRIGSYEASSGAISFGLATAVSVEGL
jgi:hypothetical protein